MIELVNYTARMWWADRAHLREPWWRHEVLHHLPIPVRLRYPLCERFDRRES